MKPLVHATISAKKFGGLPEDYQEIHDFFDWSKIAYPHMKHRAILHHSFGIFLCERIFGTYITNSDGDKVSVRDVAEQHIIDDLGRIPTVQDWLEHLELKEPWMRADKKTKFVKFDNYVPGELNEAIPKGVPNDSVDTAIIDGAAKRFRQSPGITAREVDDGTVRTSHLFDERPVPEYTSPAVLPLYNEANTD